MTKNVMEHPNELDRAVEGARIRKLLNPKATSEILGVTPETLAVWRCTKRYALRFVKVGRKIFYRPEDIEEFIALRSISGTGEAKGATRHHRSRVA